MRVVGAPLRIRSRRAVVATPGGAEENFPRDYSSCPLFPPLRLRAFATARKFSVCGSVRPPIGRPQVAQ